MDNQINFEPQTMKSFYNEPIHCSNTASSKNKPANNSLNCNYDSKTGILLYNSIPFSICVPEVYYGKTKVYIPFSEYEWDYLMATMIYELKKSLNLIMLYAFKIVLYIEFILCDLKFFQNYHHFNGCNIL